MSNAPLIYREQVTLPLFDIVYYVYIGESLPAISEYFAEERKVQSMPADPSNEGLSFTMEHPKEGIHFITFLAEKRGAQSTDIGGLIIREAVRMSWIMSDRLGIAFSTSNTRVQMHLVSAITEVLLKALESMKADTPGDSSGEDLGTL